METKKKFLDRRMITLIIMVVLVCVAVVVKFTFLGSEVTANNRYFIKSSWTRILIPERHTFPDGTTASLSKIHLILLNVFNVSFEQLPFYHVVKFPPRSRDLIDYQNYLAKDPAREFFPEEQVGWGIKKMYNNDDVRSTSGGEGIDVAVLDTGASKNLLDIRRRIVQCKDFTGKDVRDGVCEDINSHGTFISSIILADAGEDGLGIYGIAPETNLFAYKVCDNNGICFADDVAAAIRHAADEGAEIINLGFGGERDSQLVRDAVRYAANKGALLVASNNNYWRETNDIDFPAAYMEVIAVGFINENEQTDNRSGFGVNDGDFIIEDWEVEFVAPGSDVEGLWNDGSYKTIVIGASVGAAHVSGLAAKVWQGSGEATREYLRLLAKDIGEPGDDRASGFGLPQLAK